MHGLSIAEFMQDMASISQEVKLIFICFLSAVNCKIALFNTLKTSLLTTGMLSNTFYIRSHSHITNRAAILHSVFPLAILMLKKERRIV
jgi:hypothetical protein